MAKTDINLNIPHPDSQQFEYLYLHKIEKSVQLSQILNTLNLEKDHSLDLIQI